MPHRFPLRRFIWIVVAGILTGTLYGGIQYGTPMSGAAAGGQISAVYLALSSILYVTVILIIIALPPRPPTAIGSVDFLFTLVVVVGATLLLSVNDLLGPGTLFAFAAGR